MNHRGFYYCKLIILVLTTLLLTSCVQNEQVDENGVFERTSINIFKETPAWELAKAVKNGDRATIERIAKETPLLLNYQEPNYGITPLIWATGMEKYKSVKALLECGADPNITSKIYKSYGEETALSIAAGFSWVDYTAKEDPKYVNILLKFGADPNWTYIGLENGEEPGRSILMKSIRCGIEKTKALLEGGADINYKTKYGYTAAIESLNVGINATEGGLEYAHYLICEKKAVISEPYYVGAKMVDVNPNEKFYPVSILKMWIYDLDSERHKIKMDIVEEFERQGVDYWNAEVDDRTLESIQRRYPDTWETYLKRY